MVNYDYKMMVMSRHRIPNGNNHIFVFIGWRPTPRGSVGRIAPTQMEWDPPPREGRSVEAARPSKFSPRCARRSVGRTGPTETFAALRAAEGRSVGPDRPKTAKTTNLGSVDWIRIDYFLLRSP